MKPQNAKERRSSIWKFILLFVVTVLLIVTAIFFDFNQIPLHENKVWRERSEKIEKDIAFQEQFFKGMKDIKAHVDSLDVKGQNLQHINVMLSRKLVDLQNSIPKEDQTFRYDMYKQIISSYVEIQALKGELKKLENSAQLLKDYETQNRRLQDKLNETQRYLDACNNNRR
ncbi:type VI secretion system TssO [Spongiivirga sp. MCCC 1A20706]|uniref:type VI secretion system TssO n=1 Tax=Spongiivirga sp. MCCC 1A20706 TaxID=3160963 RepID=UPI0039774A34